MKHSGDDSASTVLRAFVLSYRPGLDIVVQLDASGTSTISYPGDTEYSFIAITQENGNVNFLSIIWLSIRAGTLAILCTAVLAVFMPVASFAQAIDEYSGQETFMRYCAACHGESGTGNGPVAPGLPIVVPDLTTLKARKGSKFPDELLHKIIDGREIVVVHGTRYMPVWGYEFWVEEGADAAAQERVNIIVENLIDYIRSIQR